MQAQIFLSYARDDHIQVKSLYDRLASLGFKPWMDRQDILPGEVWRSSIQAGIRNSAFFLACLSTRSNKRGFLQREIREALDIYLETLENDIYLIPVRLEECEIPDQLSHFQWVDLFAEDGWTRLLTAIRTGMARRGIGPSQPQLGGRIGNPYTWRAMIKDPAMFVGRVEEFHSLYSRLAHPQSCSVVGPRRIGKSSLLYQLTRPDNYRTHLPAAQPYIFAYVDLQELAGHESDDFFYTIADRLARSNAGGLEITPTLDGTHSGFRNLLSRATDAGVRLVVCCDEFELLTDNPRFGADFFTYLRGLCSNYDFGLVTGSRTGLHELCHQRDLQTSNFWNIFSELRLGLMSVAEAHELIERPFAQAGITVSEDEAAFVLDLAGSHPFFIQIACYHLFEAKTSQSAVDLVSIRQRFGEEANHHYAYAWDKLNDDERAALVTVRRTGGSRLEKGLFYPMNRDALLIGSPASAQVVSTGWRDFIDGIVPKPGGAQGVADEAIAPAEILHRLPTDVPVPYLDFDLRIEEIDSRSCRVLVLNSPAGQADEKCTLPFDLNETGQVLSDLGTTVFDKSSQEGGMLLSPISLGDSLFRAVFQGAVGQLFFESMGRVLDRKQGLRIKIHPDPVRSPALAALPWEFLYNFARRSFLSLNRLTPVIRYLDVQAPTMPSALTRPMRVLAVMTSPSDLPALDLAREEMLLRQALGGQREIEPQFLPSATPSQLQKVLRTWRPHVLHFMGHGVFDPSRGTGALMFNDEKGKSRLVGGQQLAVLLGNAPSVRLVVLNTCQSGEVSPSRDLDPFTGVAAALVLAGMPAVVAMQFSITDNASLAFASGLYPRLVAGDPVDVAVAAGRETIYLELPGSHEWGTPVLFMRVSDGQLFAIE